MVQKLKTRASVIEELTQIILSQANYEERELIINNNWGLSEDEFKDLNYPTELKEEMLNFNWSQNNVMSKLYEPLIKKVIFDELSDNTNSKLEKMYFDAVGEKIEIIDKEIKVNEEKLFCCPCCHNKTLSERGQYYICPICDWEDDGIDGDHLSHCNGMTLSEAQRAFCENGSIY